jgi:predicted RNase H-like nuclease (RuvC/YqgF family)
MATVKEVTLFPNSAKISETAKINPQCDKGKCISVITLPSQADPESFVVSLPAQSHVKIEDVQIKPVPVQDETKIAELRKQIAGLEASKKEMQAKLQALEVQLQFWQAQTKAKTKTLADTNKLADAIGKNVRRANQEKFAVEIQLEKSDKNIKKLQDELNQIAGKKETAWEMTLTTSGVG